jgi:superfamily II DNA/RNA helicase
VPTVVALASSAHARRPNSPRALVLVPTRELASQVAATTEPLARALGLRVAVVFGGVGQAPQVAALRRGVDVLIACPGRLEDLIAQGHCRLGAVEVTVLDEADHLADLGFLPAVTRILDKTPAGGQRLLFSATLDAAVATLVRRYLENPITHSVDSADATPPDLEHHAFTVTADHKAAVVRELASGRERSLLFTRTKHAAKKLAKDLTARGIPAVDLHGNLSQAQRDRNLAAFADGTTRVLVATDIAARGIHVDDVALVVHVDPPTEHKAYLHRSGRTARAGAKGTVVTVILPDQARDVATMIRQAGIRPAAVRIGPGAVETLALTGPVAEPVFRPQPAVAAPARPAATAARRAPGRSGPPRRRRPR